ncbi:small acid-soluble spore protein P [Paenibacillus sp. N3.4]|uniref:small acid-soluble spore protein P n=1 Tax=Paenibacillus sp. N3.4 TaxID=2603222 RepID=UPI0011CA6D36|nr:small acid-soluble spore protein P [Paenibacillus sp. N3.4]TXK76020.1 small acid-soluble spore protein P [Paenibacillus sp. N3.4]
MSKPDAYSVTGNQTQSKVDGNSEHNRYQEPLSGSKKVKNQNHSRDSHATKE